MISALLYLQACSFRNRLVTRVKRLKNPKYLIGFIVGGLWFYFYFFRYIGNVGSRKPGAVVNPLSELVISARAIELVAALVLMGFVVAGWILPHQRAALVFTEAEALYLFSAPISRRTLIHFKLLKSQAGIFITTLLMAFLSSRFGARGSGWLHLAGWWVILSTLNLHSLGSSFARTTLLDRGLTNWKRRALILGLMGAAAAAVFFWAGGTMRAPAPEEISIKRFPGYVEEVLGSGPAPYLLYPFRLVVRPFLAMDFGSFLFAVWPALILLALHYLWVIRSNVAFEEASLALSEKRAQLISAAKQGQFTPVKHKARRGPFELKSTGPPAVALLWKNLIAAGNLFRTRPVVVMLLMLTVVGFSVSLGSGGSGPGGVVAILVFMGLIWSVMLGPMVLRHDFRSDLKSMDVLKVYPLRGWRIVLGELLAPAIILVVIQWMLLFLGVLAAGAPDDAKHLGFTQRFALGCAVAIVLPMLDLISFVIPNAAVLLFPAWFQSGQDATQGIEATGQRIVFALGQFLVFLVALAPAGVAGGLVFFLARLALPWTLAAPLAALPAALVLGAEAALGIWLLGKVFEKFDLSSEPQP